MKISKDLAYFIGAMQSDGYFYNFFNKKRNRTEPKIKFCVGEKSIEMLENVQTILDKEFNKNVSIYRYRGQIRLETSVKKLMPLFETLKIDFSDPPNPQFV